jgi:Rps23 Pro-64 3,4-dihydroxylase Tpa1-like proline 4-hydroxylase
MKKKTHRRNSETVPNRFPAVFVKTNFLSTKELRGLTKYVLTHEAGFTPSTVIPDGTIDPAADPSYRKSRVLYELGDYAELIRQRLIALLPEVLSAFQREAFSFSHIDVQVTASNDGDFFKVHQDNSSVEPVDIHLRELSFVHYFHAEPKSFTGGQLRIYGSENGQFDGAAIKGKTIVPRQNTLVLFPSSADHEVLPVKCPTGKFANSRFTVNGWIIREAPASEAPASDEAEQPDMDWLIEAAKSLSLARPYPIPRLYLTLEEASEYSGLSVEYLEGLIESQQVRVIDDGGWKIRRVDLEKL